MGAGHGSIPLGRGSIANTSGLPTASEVMEVGFMGLQQSLEDRASIFLDHCSSKGHPRSLMKTSLGCKAGQRLQDFHLKGAEKELQLQVF